MEGIFGTMWIDILVAALFGALGGLGLGLMQKKGLEIPRFYKEKEDEPPFYTEKEGGMGRPVHTEKGDRVLFVKLGFLNDVFIGAVAAIIFYAMNPPTAPIRLVALAVTAGLTGSAILKGYINGEVDSERASLVDNYKIIAERAMRGEDVTKDMNEVKEMEKQMKKRWPNRM